ncbi:MAG: BamA/TamA family outer membrane protein, partial [Acidobacteria bacterium]|nr:BamA/TamA family outer membrane protein [Acidobacteriota bacterium]
TFGTHDDGAAQFVDGNTLVFPSTATDPRTPIDPDVARNGRIYNVWTLDLRTGALNQYTDALGGNLSPVPLAGRDRRIAFVTYEKGEYGVHTIDGRAPLHTSATDDFGAPGPVVDFQAPLTHTLAAEHKKKKGTFGKLFPESRPPVNVGVTSGGDLFGGTAVSFADVLGDRRIDLTILSVSQYRTIAGSYIDLSRRLQWAAQGFSQTQFFFGQAGAFFDPAFSGFIDRDLATATRTVRGGSVFGIYPFDRYRRLEISAGVAHYSERFEDPGLEQFSRDFQQAQFGRSLFRDGTFVPLTAAFVQETTVFRPFGPLAGNTMRLAYEYAPGIGGGALSRQTVDADLRYYQRLGANGVLALRARGFRSSGDSPDFLFFGGNSEMHGYEYLEFLGQNAFFGNAELRFPLIDAMATPIGILGGIRGLFFFNIGGAWFDDTGFTFATSSTQTVQPVIGARITPLAVEEVLGPPTQASGFRLKDGRASYGLGLETFALGFPVHFDWSWRTLFNKQWEDVLFARQGGSSAFRKARFDVWIGYDF